MKCRQCRRDIPQDDRYEHAGNLYCEDCYIQILSPARFCDPWADYSAKSFEKHGMISPLTEPQKMLLKLIKELGKAEPAELIEHTRGAIDPADGERELAALSRMGKIEIKSVEGKAIIRAL
ncbi:hypothetical protein [Desulfatibacillum aliphaticivorans]|uniref:hypothetical protein n=1 Tax=Desulfatibacillum aliphaticivorans TaxID=218208 RepID=UPI00041A9BF7|nr:hypothetical protein [Desulfatibacillum aliphaticivorans]